jgi:hypothetical protein
MPFKNEVEVQLFIILLSYFPQMHLMLFMIAIHITIPQGRLGSSSVDEERLNVTCLASCGKSGSLDEFRPLYQTQCDFSSVLEEHLFKNKYSKKIKSTQLRAEM